jgi:hypothetical protein
MIIPKTVKLPRKLKKELKRVDRVTMPNRWLHQPDISKVTVMLGGYDYLFEKQNKWSHRLKLIFIREDKKHWRILGDNYIKNQLNKQLIQHKMIL